MSIRGTGGRGAASLVVRMLVGFCAAIALTLCFAARGEATITYQSAFGSSGSGTGQFNTPAGIAVNEANGDIYVVDRGNNRIQQFTSAGTFIRMWGSDVVESGTDDNPTNEVQAVTIRSDSGIFTLTFGGNTTTPLPSNATAGEVQTALNELASINTGGGSVSVTGGPGNAAGSNPYLVTFSGGPLANTDVPQMTLNANLLGVPVGTQLTCTPQRGGSFQWLTDGEPATGPGANSSTYTTVAADAGKPVQCQVTQLTANSGATTTFSFTSGVPVVSPYPATEPPVGPTSIAAPNPANPTVGTVLTCAPGTWTGAPSFTYRWYKDGVEIPGAVESTYELTAADIPGNIQCGVLGTNAGGTVLKTTYFERLTSPPPSPGPPGNQSITISVAANATSTVATQTGGAGGFEICNPAPPTTDVCKAGRVGGQMGGFSAPRGIAVDNSAGGNHDVYVVDDNNFRVEKFTSDGQPLMTMGWEVDKTTGGDICTVASGDRCGAGLESNSGIPGRFGKWQVFEELGNEVAVDSAGDLYVADARENSELKPAIEKFDPSGNFIGQAIVPTLLTNPGFFPRPISIAVGESDVVYASISTGEGVQPYLQSLFTLSGEEGPGKAASGVLDGGGEPTHVAIDRRTGLPIVVDSNFYGSLCGSFAGFFATAVVLYEPNGEMLDCVTGLVSGLGGMAMSTDGHIYASLQEENQVDVLELPMEKPTLGGGSVGNISTESALVTSEIDPGYEVTEYGVEYGTADCSSNPCAKADGGTLKRFAHPVTRSVGLEGLEPGVKYHYRLLATNSRGTSFGPDRTFVTYPFLNLAHDPCPNALARQQTGSEPLFDCRAYELVSAEFTGGYDVESSLIAGQTPFESYPDANGKVLYSVHGGGIPGTGEPTNRGRDPYVATRNSDGTWSTEYVGIPANDPFASEPFSSTLYEADPGLDTLAYGGPEICSPCFNDGSSGIPVHRPDGSLVQGLKGSISQISAVPSGFIGRRLSADGSHLVFGSTSKLEPAGNSGSLSIYERNLSTSSTQVVSTLPSGETMSGEVGELDVSADGSRVVVGELISTDADGNRYYHLYMHISGSSDSIDLTPGTVSGALFDGMTEDGSNVYFTTGDPLTTAANQDTDNSADIYRVDVTGSSATLTRVTTGAGAGNSDACEPPGGWNSVSGGENCDAVAIAGGGGVASESGTIYFVSPEVLDTSGSTQPEQNQANLYAATPGSAPRFVATVDSSVGKPPPPPPIHELTNSEFVSGSTLPVSLAVEQNSGDLYVGDAATGNVSRWKPNGEPDEFAALGSNAVSTPFESWTESQIAVDSSNSAFKGDLYVPNNGGSVFVYNNDGEEIGALTGFGEACGVAVDQSNGDVYVGSYPNRITRFRPKSSLVTPVTNLSYEAQEGITVQGGELCNIDVSAEGHIYEWPYFGGSVRQFETSAVSGSFPTVSGKAFGSAEAKNVQTDPVTGYVYFVNSSSVTSYEPNGTELENFGSLSSGAGVGVDAKDKRIYVGQASNGHVLEFGAVAVPYEVIENPFVHHGVTQSGVHSYEDFQVTPSGEFAAFPTKQRLDSTYNNGGHTEVYRYSLSGNTLSCVSCIPTEASPSMDAALPSGGLGLDDQGRVFFNSREQLTAADKNGNKDAYEWKNGQVQLISTGTSPTDASLLGVDREGTDVYLFTRDTLVPNDRNGQAMKIYDAREEGGRFLIPPEPPCAASDECHGPGTQAAPPPAIGTFRGEGGQATPKKPPCKKGFVRRHGKCVKKHSHPHGRHHHRRSGR